MKHFIVLMGFLMLSALSFSQTLYFPPLSGNTWETTDPATLGWCPDKIDSMYTFLEESNSKGFIVLKNGKIVLEKYFGSFTQDSLWYWASAGKTITALLTGIAQEDGDLSIQNPSSDYLGSGWSSLTTAQEDAITVRHHLSMTTGLDDATASLDCTLPACLTYLAPPGTRWSYHNAPYTLLDSIIRNATGQTLNGYTNSKLKQKTGMTGLWIKSGYNNVYLSNARSMARFGLMIQNKAIWNGQTVLGDTAYFNDMTTTSQNLNLAYGYLWWLNGSNTYMLPGPQLVLNGSAMPDAPADMIAAMGKNGQIINIIPSTGMVVVRIGNLPTAGVFVPNFYNNDIWEHLNNLTCTGASISENDLQSISLYPNPAEDFIQLSGMETFTTGEVKIVNSMGQCVRKQTYTGEALDISGLSKGIYYITYRQNKVQKTLRFVKQ